MREITSHIVDGDNQAHQIKITVLDAPGAGGANHVYNIEGMQLERNTAALGVPDEIVDQHVGQSIIFQCGGIAEHGVNGITNEALLAIVKDRLEKFQDGPFPAQENATALSSINNALRALQQRTLKRIARGVEGKTVA